MKRDVFHLAAKCLDQHLLLFGAIDNGRVKETYRALFRVERVPCGAQISTDLLGLVRLRGEIEDRLRVATRQFLVGHQPAAPLRSRSAMNRSTSITSVGESI